jgi:hypothetical protein
MKKIAVSLFFSSAVCILGMTPAHADGYYRGGGNYWVAPFVTGAVIGGVIGSVLTPPPPVVYVAPPQVYSPAQCWQEIAYYDAWNRPVYRTVCQ